MGAQFTPYDPDQSLLLPPSLRDWLPEDHLCYFVSDTVDQLDISKITKAYRAAGSGNVAYHPRLMLKLLIFGYCTGVFSSRRIAKAIEENVPFRVLAAGQSPSHRSLCRFRQTHIKEFASLFTQVAQIAAASGLARMGTIAIDGTKVKADASKHKAMSYERMQAEEARLVAEIATLIAAADDQDALEDIEFGPDFRGDEIPKELRRREDRLRTIRAAKERLEARKREQDESAIKQAEAAEAAAAKAGQKRRGRKRKHPLGAPKDTDQENFTDPDSRIMKTSSGGFEQCFNAQAAVDADHQIIVAADITQSPADSAQLLPMIEQAGQNTGTPPSLVLADAGYRSEENFKALAAAQTDALIPLGREGKKARAVPPDKPATADMKRKLGTKRGRKRYADRKHIVEPVFGWLKRGLGFRSFSLRGLEKVTGEWSLVCLALNLKRMNNKIAW